MNKISVVIIAYNEANKIAEAIQSVKWADEIIVIDSHSTDDTAQIAASLGAKVVQVSFNGFGNLRNQAVEACQHDWIFTLDADERCTEEASAEIIQIINSKRAKDAYSVPRKNIFMGRWIKYSWPYPNYRQPQLFKKGAMVYENHSVHENFKIVTGTAAGHMKNPIWQIPFRDLEEMLNKTNRYSSLSVEKLSAKNFQPRIWKVFSHALLSFFKHYIFRRGFLDGWPGFVIAFNNFEQAFYRYAKYLEYTAGQKKNNI